MFDVGQVIALGLHKAVSNPSAEPISSTEFAWQVHEDWLNVATWYDQRTGERARRSRSNAAAAAAAAAGPVSPPRPARPDPMSPALHKTPCQPFPQRTKNKRGDDTIHHDGGNCVACGIEGLGRRWTSWGCSDCSPPVFLHPTDECFHRYHRKLAAGDWKRPYQRKRRKTEVKDEKVNNKRRTNEAIRN